RRQSSSPGLHRARPAPSADRPQPRRLAFSSPDNASHPMQAVVYSLTALWAGVNLILMVWDGYLSLQMLNYRVQKEWPISGGGRKFSFQTDPTDYTEIGQMYRRKSIRVETALLIWGFGFPILFSAVISVLTGK